MVLVLGAQRRRTDIAGALEARRAQMVFQIQIQILRAGLGEHIQPFVAGGRHLLQSFRGREMHEIHRRAGHDRKLYRPMRGFAF